MKKTVVIAILSSLFMGGCSKTWDGMKQDSYNMYEGTKEAIHEATASDDEVYTNQNNALNDKVPQVGDKVDVDALKAKQEETRHTANQQVETIQPQTTVTINQ